LHVRGGNSSEIYNALNSYYTNLGDLIDQRNDMDLVDYNWSVREEPLELIAHVVMNDKPYSEILTANYTMVNDATTQLYNSGVTTNGQWKVGRNKNQSVRSSTRRLEDSDREISVQHAGILSSIGFNARWQSTATNRNRARAKYVLLHFLGYDIEATASRDFSDEALADTNNPTMNNPTCVQCHEVLDPIAGAFQNVGDIGMQYDRTGSDGMDSLDATYVNSSEHYVTDARWYGDMRAPGYYGSVLPDRNKSLQWLAEQVVNDVRFAEAAVKFWWPTLFGEEFFHDALSTQQKNERINTLSVLAARFRASNNLKFLLTDMMLTPWYRAESKDTELSDSGIVYYTGGKRLLTPEELVAKTSDLAGVVIDGYANDFGSFYGGIDSSSSLIRSREMTSLMNKVLERVAYENSCNIVAAEFNKAQGSRNLFVHVEPKEIAGTQYLASQGNVSTATKTSANNDKATLSFTSIGLPIRLRLDPTGKPMYLGRVTIKDSQNKSVLDQYGADFVLDHGIDTNAATNSTNKLSSANKAAYLRNSQVQVFEVELPAGSYQLEWTSWRVDPDLPYELHVTLEMERNNSVFHSPQLNPELAKQMQTLVSRLHGRYVDVNATEVKQLIQLFDAARQAKVERGSHSDMVESGVYCTYDDPENRKESEWGNDPYDTLHAWKVVVAALMTSFEFAYE
jgi:hypothetical protein